MRIKTNEKEKKKKKTKNLKRRVRDEVDDLASLTNVVETLALEADKVGVSRASAKRHERQIGYAALSAIHTVLREDEGIRSSCESDARGSDRNISGW